METTERYPEEVRERAVRMVAEYGVEPIGLIAPVEFAQAYYRSNETHAVVA